MSRLPTSKAVASKIVLVAFATGFATLSSATAYAKKNCTTEPKEKWMSVEEFKKQKEAEGYKIRKFKQPGTCYEIYGTDQEGNNIEIYFNPVDGSIVKSKVLKKKPAEPKSSKS